MSEALVLANGLVKSRGAIAALSGGRGNGRNHLLGQYGYGDTANTLQAAICFDSSSALTVNW